MGKSLLLSLLLVAAATSCASEPPTTPLAPTEAIANVQTLMKTVKPTDAGKVTCYQYIRGWDDAVAEHVGDGEWIVRVGDDWEWSYFEGSNAVLTSWADASFELLERNF
jgi:hypothetical protein|tara:strand:- start:472 stop:798 length:327 start_codon:yes stop_codon:yes gene_type:complete